MLSFVYVQHFLDQPNQLHTYMAYIPYPLVHMILLRHISMVSITSLSFYDVAWQQLDRVGSASVKQGVANTGAVVEPHNPDPEKAQEQEKDDHHDGLAAANGKPNHVVLQLSQGRSGSTVVCFHAPYVCA